MFRFQAARYQLPDRPEEASDALDSALISADQAIAEGRSAIQELRLGSSAESNLEQTLLATGRELASSQDGGDGAPPLRMVVEGQRRAKRAMIREEIYRIARDSKRTLYVRHSLPRAALSAHSPYKKLVYLDCMFQIQNLNVRGSVPTFQQCALSGRPTLGIQSCHLRALRFDAAPSASNLRPLPLGCAEASDMVAQSNFGIRIAAEKMRKATMLIPKTLRIDPGNGSSIVDYRIKDGDVESRIVDSASVGSENDWRLVKPEQLSSHVMSNNVVAYWLRHRMGLHALLRACTQSCSRR